MSYLRTEKVVNGDHFENFIIYKCDITGKEMPENFGWFGNENIHISEEGVEIILEQWIERMKNGYLIPIAIKYLEDRFLQRINPDRYIPKKTRNEVLIKFKHTCVYCGATDNLQIDHIYPVSKGGVSQIKNLQVLCKKCNIKKSNKIEKIINENSHT